MMWLRVCGDKIAHGSFSCNGCLAAVACCSAVLDLASGRTLSVASMIEPRDVVALVRELPDGKGQYADLAVAALQAAISSPVNS